MKRRDFVRAGAGIFVTATLLDDSVSLSAENVVSIRPRLGCGFRSDQLQPADVERLPLIEIEDFLDPTFADHSERALPELLKALDTFRGPVLLSGPFIDLNPGTAESLIREATFKRFQQALRFAASVRAREIIYLSSYIPIINLSFYDRSWIENSTRSWQSYMDTVPDDTVICLANTFEYHPDNLVAVVKAVARTNFRLAFDLGHFLVYAREGLSTWLEKIGPLCRTVYVHSNDGQIDTHEAPGKGRLSRPEMHQVIGKLSSETRFILKMNDKTSREAALAWVDQCTG